MVEKAHRKDWDWDYHKSIQQKCVAPWHSLTIQWDGAVYADAISRIEYGSLYDKTLSELWQSDTAVKLRKSWADGKPDPEICYNCIKKEKTVGNSRRKYFYRNISPQLLRTATYDINAEPDIWYLEINSSNKCNLKCRMCGGEVSSTWIKEEKQLNALSPEWMPFRKEGKYHRVEFDAVKNILEKREYFENLEFLKFAGGEPLMEDQNYQIMEQFIEWGISKNIVLDINTNGTMLNPRLFNIAKNFKKVKFHISIEGTGKLYQYIRGGDNFTIEQLEANIKEFNKLENTQIIYTVTVQVYNIYDITNIWKWYKKIRKPGDEIFFTNVVVYPRYLNMHILSPTMKWYAYKMMKDADLPIGDFKLPGESAGQGDPGFSNLMKNLYGKHDFMEVQERKKYLREFIQFTKSVDKIRNTDVMEVVPQLKSLFEERVDISSEDKWSEIYENEFKE